MKLSNQTMSNKIKLILVAAIALLGTLFFSYSVNAQEITPAAGTYSYGSTSEFSPYVALTASTTLAPTGADQNTGYLAFAVLALAASGILLYLAKNRLLPIKISK